MAKEKKVKFVKRYDQVLKVTDSSCLPAYIGESKTVDKIKTVESVYVNVDNEWAVPIEDFFLGSTVNVVKEMATALPDGFQGIFEDEAFVEGLVSAGCCLAMRSILVACDENSKLLVMEKVKIVAIGVLDEFRRELATRIEEQNEPNTVH